MYRDPNLRWVIVGVFAFCFSFLSFTVVKADTASGPLDGMIFVGKIGPKGNPDLDDELHFRDGKFWSDACTKCGFKPGEYWVRNLGDRIQFRGELVGDRGTFVYKGEVYDNQAKVSIGWTKSRWYWKIDSELEFAGTLQATMVSQTLDKAILTASSAKTEKNPLCRR